MYIYIYTHIIVYRNPVHIYRISPNWAKFNDRSLLAANGQWALDWQTRPEERSTSKYLKVHGYEYTNYSNSNCPLVIEHGNGNPL